MQTKLIYEIFDIQKAFISNQIVTNKEIVYFGCNKVVKKLCSFIQIFSLGIIENNIS